MSSEGVDLMNSGPDEKQKLRNSPGSSMDENQAENGKIALKKNITLVDGIGLIAGTVIGSGIFISPTGILVETNSIGLALLIWLGCGLLAMFGCLCYAELGAFVTKSGAEYAYLMEAFGKIPAYLFAWTSILIIRPASGAIIALIFGEYVAKPFFPNCRTPPAAAVKLLACVCLVVITGINCWSVKWATRVQDIFTYAKLLCIAMLTIIGIVELCRGKTEHFENSFQDSYFSVAKIGLAFYIGLWAYDGWNNLNYCTEEMKNPEKDMPRAIVIGISLITVCYLLINVAYITVLGKSGILISPAVAVSVGNLYLGPVTWIVPLFVAASTFGAVNGMVLTNGRLLYVAARDGLMPSLLAMINVKRFTPLPSLLFTTLISIVMLIPDSSKFTTLVDFFSFAAWLFYGGTFFSLLWLRYKQPNKRRPYRVWIIVPVGMSLASIYLIIAPIFGDPMGSLIALAVILAGLPFYFFFVYSDLSPKWLNNGVDSFTSWCQKVFDLAMTDPEEVPVPF
ncbi:b(0,+)-type amino acid transporter 1-like [Actinia tenebrosa]|uniref:b(0,+)-type amino acid transporter 1 n=1 Tax=Actinia tenebrosa TaxID=6105 RepID=A0A6P8I8I9_ACTTE|nr:b(0,+)-type amino acid transporter 1-like [Actinia tenebrosa]